MKKLRLFAVALFATMFATTNAQTVVDIGYDWDGSALVNSTSGNTFSSGTSSYTLNPGTDNELDINFVNGSASSTIVSDNKSLYKQTTSKSIVGFQIKSESTDYLDFAVKNTKKISSIKINGTSSSTTLTGNGVIVYSSATPFSESAITGYDILTLAPCRAGDTGKTFSTSIPGGTKSFRLYKGIYLTKSGDLYVVDASGTLIGGDQIRIAYASVTIEDGAAATTPSIGLSSGSNSQTVYPNQSIKDIVYTWGGTATTANIQWTPSAPAGISANLSTDNKTLTITGTPTESTATTYSYSVTSTDGSQTSTALTGSIAVKMTDKYKLAYVTALTNDAPANEADKKISDALADKFDVNFISADATGTDYSIYDIIVLSAYPTSTAAGVLAMKNAAITKPFLNMKAFALQSSSNRWAWLDFVKNTPVTNIIVPAAEKSHPIFSGVTWTGTNSDEIQMTTATSGNCVIYYSAWTNTTSPIVLASVLDTSNVVYPSFAEVPVGTTLGGMTSASTAKQILYNLSEASWPSITADGVKVAVNAARYLVDDFSGINNRTNDNANKVVVKKEYFDLLGKQLPTCPVNTISIVKKTYEDGSVSYEKTLYKK